MADERMSLRDAIEYIRNDEAYVAATAAADSYDALRAAAQSALDELEESAKGDHSAFHIATYFTPQFEDCKEAGCKRRRNLIKELRTALNPKQQEAR